MKNKNIDEFWKDVTGDESFKEWSEKTKAGMAILTFIYSRTAMTKEETEEMIDELPAWMEAMKIEPTISIENTLKELREKGILNSANRFKVGKNIDSGILWILFGTVLEGDLQCTFDREKGDYMFQSTSQGIEKAKKIMENL